MLQGFVRDRIMTFVTEPAFSKRLYMTPDVMKQAAAEAFAELARPVGVPVGHETSSQYRLVFRHDCLYAPQTLQAPDQHQFSSTANSPSCRCSSQAPLQKLADCSLPREALEQLCKPIPLLVQAHSCGVLRSLGCLDPECGLCRQTLHRRCVGTFAPKYLSGDQLKAKCGAPIRVEVFDHATGLPVPGEQLSDIHIEVQPRPWHSCRALPLAHACSVSMLALHAC